VEEGEVVAGELVEAGKHTPVVLDLADTLKGTSSALHQVPLLVKLFVVVTCVHAVGTRRNHRLSIHLFNLKQDALSVIGLVP
jgi:hypothetical protein